LRLQSAEMMRRCRSTWTPGSLGLDSTQLPDTGSPRNNPYVQCSAGRAGPRAPAVARSVRRARVAPRAGAPASSSHVQASRSSATTEGFAIWRSRTRTLAGAPPAARLGPEIGRARAAVDPGGTARSAGVFPAGFHAWGNRETARTGRGSAVGTPGPRRPDRTHRFVQSRRKCTAGSSLNQASGYHEMFCSFRV
jgi:hypothetical protein